MDRRSRNYGIAFAITPCVQVGFWLWGGHGSHSRIRPARVVLPSIAEGRCADWAFHSAWCLRVEGTTIAAVDNDDPDPSRQSSHRRGLPLEPHRERLSALGQ